MEAIQVIEDSISSDSSSIANVIESVGLNEDGTMPEISGASLDNPESIIKAIESLDEAIASGHREEEERASNIIEAVGLGGDGKYIVTGDEYTSGAASVAEAVKALNDQAVNNQTETDRIESAVGLDENGDYIRKTAGHYVNDANSIEEEIAALDEQIHDDDRELENTEASIGLKVGKGDLPDEYTSTNIIENGMTVIEAIESIDRKIGTPSDVRLEGQTDEEISLYAYINESDYGEF